MYVIEKRVWETDDSSLYKKSNAPEIAINMRVKTQFINEYVAKQRDKRRADSESTSLDILSETSPDGYYIPDTGEDIDTKMYLTQIMSGFFKRKEYANAFIFDAIITDGAFYKSNSEFSIGRLKSYIQKIDDFYCKIFAINYGLTFRDVVKAYGCVSKGVTTKDINRLFRKLKEDKEFYLCLHDA